MPLASAYRPALLLPMLALAIFAILIYLSYIATKPPSDVVPLPVLWLVVHNRHVCMLTN